MKYIEKRFRDLVVSGASRLYKILFKMFFLDKDYSEKNGAQFVSINETYEYKKICFCILKRKDRQTNILEYNIRVPAKLINRSNRM